MNSVCADGGRVQVFQTFVSGLFQSTRITPTIIGTNPTSEDVIDMCCWFFIEMETCSAV